VQDFYKDERPTFVVHYAGSSVAETLRKLQPCVATMRDPQGDGRSIALDTVPLANQISTVAD
jgi:hypothetical protein